MYVAVEGLSMYMYLYVSKRCYVLIFEKCFPNFAKLLKFFVSDQTTNLHKIERILNIRQQCNSSAGYLHIIDVQYLAIYMNQFTRSIIGGNQYGIHTSLLLFHRYNMHFTVCAETLVLYCFALYKYLLNFKICKFENQLVYL